MGLLILAFLMHMNFICAMEEILIGYESPAGRESRLGMALWQLLLIASELGLYVTYTENNVLTELFRVFFLLMGVLSVFIGFGVIGRRTLREARETSPIEAKSPMIENWDDLGKEHAFTLGGLILNLTSMVLFGICGWATKSKHVAVDKRLSIWNFEMYSVWIFQYLIVSAFTSIGTIFATLTVQVSGSVVPDAIMEVTIAFLMILIGLLTCVNYKNKKNVSVNNA